MYRTLLLTLKKHRNVSD